eukprot:7027-Pleurochrysis_carterae.AAC.1
MGIHVGGEDECIADVWRRCSVVRGVRTGSTARAARCCLWRWVPGDCRCCCRICVQAGERGGAVDD